MEFNKLMKPLRNLNLLFLLFFLTGCTQHSLDASKKENEKLYKIVNIINNQGFTKNILQVPSQTNDSFDIQIKKLFKNIDNYSYYKKLSFKDYFSNNKKSKMIIKLINNQLHIKIPYFYKGLSKDLEKSLQSIQKNTRHIIIDLRGNKGGLVDEAIQAVDMFVDHGELVTIQKRNYKQTFYAKKETTLTKLPLSILVDKDTASSSELFAGVLQAKDRAKLKGEKTYGKPYIQSLIYLDESKSDFMMLTTGMFLLPNKKDIHKGLGVYE